MEAIAIVLMLMKPDHSMMELGKYKSMKQCEQAMEVAKHSSRKDTFLVLKKVKR